MHKKLIVAVFTLSFLTLSFSCEEVWMKTADLGISKKLAVTQENDLIFSSFITDNSGNEDLALIKMDSSGNLVWTKLYGGEKSEGGDFAFSLDDGNYLIVGATNSFGEGIIDIWILKTDAEGNVLWQKTCGGPDVDFAWFAMATADGGALMAMPDKNWDTVVLKIDKDGNVVWQKVYSGRNYTISAISEDPKGGYFIGLTGGDYTSLILKVGENGDILWQKKYKSGTQLWINDIKKDGENAVVAARVQDADIKHGSALFKIDTSGNVLWQKYYTNDFDYSGLPFVTKRAYGGYILNSSVKVSSDASDWDAWAVGLDSQGDILWEKQFGGSLQDTLYDVKETSDGGYSAIGIFDDVNEDKFWLMKLNSSGSIGVSCPFEKAIQSTVGDFTIQVADKQLFSAQDLNFVSYDTDVVPQDGTVSFNSLCSNCPTITLSPSSLPDGKSGAAYSQQFAAEGGTSPYSFNVSEGSLPSGLTLSGDGLLTGTPTVSGVFDFAVTVTDANYCGGTQSYSLNVAVTPPVIDSVKKATSPFRLIVKGSNFQSDAQVFIGGDETPWINVKYKNSAAIVLKGGSSLKSKFPKGLPVEIKIVNGDDGSATFTYTR